MSELLTVDVRAELGGLRLRLDGDLDVSTVDVLTTCLDAIDDGVRLVTLDLGGLEFLDSTGLNLFVQLHRRYEPQLRQLVIANPRPAARRVLELSGVDRLIPVTDGVLHHGVGEPA